MYFDCDVILTISSNFVVQEDGQHNQLWNLVDGNIQLRHNPKLIINVESNKDGSRVQLVENKATKITANACMRKTTKANLSP